MAPKLLPLLVSSMAFASAVFAMPNPLEVSSLEVTSLEDSLQGFNPMELDPMDAGFLEKRQTTLTDPQNAGHGYQFISCWTDTSASRTLRYNYARADWGGPNNMTIENCANNCNYYGLPFMGVEYYSQVSIASLGVFSSSKRVPNLYPSAIATAPFRVARQQHSPTVTQPARTTLRKLAAEETA